MDRFTPPDVTKIATNLKAIPMACVSRWRRAARLPAWVVLGVIVGLAICAGSVQASTYESDFAAFVKEVDNTYPFFDLKGNRPDWDKAKARLSEKVKTCASDSEFLGLVNEAIRTLRDSHMGIRDAKAEAPRPPVRYCPGISLMPATDNRVVIMAPGKFADTFKVGMTVTKIDGKDARSLLDQTVKDAWTNGTGLFSPSSPQRLRLYVYRIPLAGDKGDKHTLSYLADGQERELAVTCEEEARGWPHWYNMPEGVTRVGRSFSYTKLPSGVGYMYLRNEDGDTEPGMRQAIEAHPDATGWIIDLRGNGGGGYDQALLDRIKALPQPVAALIDAGCMSAGETLARDLVALAGARLFGSKTAGASSAKRTWTFPSGIATVVFATRSRWRGDGKPIEFNGIDPDVEVEAVPEEVMKGMNSEIRRAEEFLLKAVPPATPSSPSEKPQGG